jgi:hypothetical protein
MKPPEFDPRDLLIQFMRSRGLVADDKASFAGLLAQLGAQMQLGDDYPRTVKGEGWQSADYPLNHWESQGESWRN